MKNIFVSMTKTAAAWIGSISLILVGCKHDTSLNLNLENICRQYSIDRYAYFCAENEKVTEEQINWNDDISLGEQWIDELCVPLAFQNAMDIGKIDSRKELNQLTTVRTIHERLLPENLFRIEENCPSLFYQNGNEAQQYMMRILKIISTDALHQFKQQELGMETPDVWDAKHLLRATEKISAYMERNAIAGFRPVGDNIPDLYPTWFVENTHQLASWHVFRINGHTVLWKGFLYDEIMMLSLKFVDMGKTLAIIAPQVDCMNVFDRNRQPDLLLSPFAVAVMKNVFLPDEKEIDYDDEQEQLCIQFRIKRHSPYLALYVKELLGQMIFSKNKNQKQYDKLAHVYTTIFSDALPLEYVEKTPVAAVNYVCNGTKAFRVVVLPKKGRFSVFYSEQRMMHRTKTDKEGKKGQSKAVDFCWIENRQDSTIVWESTRRSGIPITRIRVEKDEVVLPAGEYVIHYVSDEKHSFEKWLGYSPMIDDYGVRLYQEN